MKANELRERSNEELIRLRDEASEKSFRARIDNATHQLTNTSELTKGRKEIARINTILAERKIDNGDVEVVRTEEE